MEIVLKGCENSKKTSNPSINYIDGILTSWYHKGGIKTLEDIKIKDTPPERKEYQKNTKKIDQLKQNKLDFIILNKGHLICQLKN